MEKMEKNPPNKFLKLKNDLKKIIFSYINPRYILQEIQFAHNSIKNNITNKFLFNNKFLYYKSLLSLENTTINDIKTNYKIIKRELYSYLTHLKKNEIKKLIFYLFTIFNKNQTIFNDEENPFILKLFKNIFKNSECKCPFNFHKIKLSLYKLEHLIYFISEKTKVINIKNSDDYNSADYFQINFQQIISLDLSNSKHFNDCFDNHILYEYIEELPNLKSLNLSNLNFINFLTNEIIKKLAKINFNNLEYLNLSKNNLNYFEEINFPNLKILNLSNCKLKEQTMIDFIKIEIPSLQELDLSGNSLTSNCVRYLGDMELEKLENLNLSANGIGKEGVEYLSKMNLPLLRKLNLEKNLISKFFNIMKLSSLSKLEYLNVRRNFLEEKNLNFELNFKEFFFRNLIAFDLRDTAVNVKLLEEFEESNFPNLKYLFVKCTNQTKEVLCSKFCGLLFDK